MNNELHQMYSRFLERRQDLFDARMFPQAAIISQDYHEMVSVLNLLKDIAPANVLEIGVLYGIWAYLFGMIMPEGSVYIGIDPKPMKEFKWIEDELYKERRYSHPVKLPSQEALRAVRCRMSFLGIPGFDVLHIDGSHNYTDVKFDWENYSPLVRPGGYIILHDVYSTGGGAHGVGKLWHEIFRDYRVWFFRNAPSLREAIHTKGTAVLRMPSEMDEIVGGKHRGCEKLDDPLSLIDG